MENNEKIKELVAALDKELEQHNLTFDEYLLYKAIHTFEHADEDTLNSLEKKGLLKDGKVTNKNYINSVEDTLHNFIHKFSKKDEGIWESEDFTKLISFMTIYRNGGRNF